MAAATPGSTAAHACGCHTIRHTTCDHRQPDMPISEQHDGKVRISRVDGLARVSWQYSWCLVSPPNATDDRGLLPPPPRRNRPDAKHSHRFPMVSASKLLSTRTPPLPHPFRRQEHHRQEHRAAMAESRKKWRKKWIPRESPANKQDAREPSGTFAGGSRLPRPRSKPRGSGWLAQPPPPKSGVKRVPWRRIASVVVNSGQLPLVEKLPLRCGGGWAITTRRAGRANSSWATAGAKP